MLCYNIFDLALSQSAEESFKFCGLFGLRLTNLSAYQRILSAMRLCLAGQHALMGGTTIFYGFSTN
jgi:hypothetical protein